MSWSDIDSTISVAEEVTVIKMADSYRSVGGLEPATSGASGEVQISKDKLFTAVSY